MVPPELTPKGDEQQVTQREVMLRMVRECGGDQARAVHTYAAAERRGEVTRETFGQVEAPCGASHALGIRSNSTPSWGC